MVISDAAVSESCGCLIIRWLLAVVGTREQREHNTDHTETRAVMKD